MSYSDLPKSIFDITITEHVAADDEDEEKDELLSLCSYVDGVISHLQKQVETLKSYQRQPQDSMEADCAVQSRIVDMYDVCAYVHVNKATLTLTQEDTLLQRSTKLRCQLLLATCAVFAQKLLHRSSYTSGYRLQVHVHLAARAETYWSTDPCFSYAC